MALFLLAETGEHIPLCKPPVSALIKRDGGTRKRFPHHTAPSLAVGWGACWRAFLADLGERKPSYKGEAPALIKRDGGTRKRFPLTHPSPCGWAERGACWRLFYLAGLGEHRLPGASMPVHPALPAVASVYPPAGSDRGYPGRTAPGTWPSIRRAVPSGARPAVPAGSGCPTWFPN